MNKKTIILSTVLLSATLMTGCTFKGSPSGNVVEISGTDMLSLDKMKKGQACVDTLLGWAIPSVEDGALEFDYSAKKASENGGISKIAYHEYEYNDYILAGSACTTVYGK